MKKIRLMSAALMVLLTTSCDRLDIQGMFWSHGDRTEARVDQWLQWNADNGEPVISGVADNYKIYVCSDVHLTDSAPRLAQMLSAEGSDPDAIFSIVNGDIANESGEVPFRVADSVIRMAADPCYVTLGNHDIYFDCQEHFARYFHTSTYTITVNTVGGHKDLWVMTDSGNATMGKRQTEWLRALLKRRGEYRNVVVCTHTCLFRTSYNYSTTPAANLPEEEQYALQDMMSKNHVDLFVMGHFHHKEQQVIGGVKYVMTDNLNEDKDAPSYLVVSCGNDVDYEYVEL